MNDKSKAVYVMVGIPGTGKSTQVGHLNSIMMADSLPFVYSTDTLIEKSAEEQGKTYSEIFKDEIGPATEKMDKLLTDAIAQGQSVIHDQTNMSRKKREKILSKFSDEYVKYCLVFTAPTNENEQKVLDERLANRPGKVISKDVMQSMLDRFEYPTEDEGFDSIIEVKTL